eukprot:6186205-Pleurochrysis_carterae.AAC.3
MASLSALCTFDLRAPASAAHALLVAAGSVYASCATARTIVGSDKALDHDLSGIKDLFSRYRKKSSLLSHPPLWHIGVSSAMTANRRSQKKTAWMPISEYHNETNWLRGGAQPCGPTAANYGGIKEARKSHTRHGCDEQFICADRLHLYIVVPEIIEHLGPAAGCLEPARHTSTHLAAHDSAQTVLPVAVPPGRALVYADMSQVLSIFRTPTSAIAVSALARQGPCGHRSDQCAVVPVVLTFKQMDSTYTHVAMRGPEYTKNENI